MLRRKQNSPIRTGLFKKISSWLKTRPRKSRHQAESTEDPSDRLKVYLFNVGQGDHILLELPNGEYGIIDFYFEGEVGLREPPALTYLENVRLQSPQKPIVISFVCLSHTDFDHVKGVDTFLSWAREHDIKIKNFWLPAGRDFSKLYEQYEVTLKKYARGWQEKSRGGDFKDRLRGVRDYLESRSWTGHTDDLQGAIRSLNADLGGVEVVLLAPLTRHIKKFDEQVWRSFFRSIIQNTKNTSAQTNLMSSVLLMILGDHHKLLFGGDTGLDVWLECLDEFDRTRQARHFGEYRAGFIKASHHGSKNSSSVDLWDRIIAKNTYLGISAGKRYGHPHGQTLREFHHAARQRGADVRIVSTNVCTLCLGAQKLDEEFLDKLVHRRSLKPQVVQGLKQNKPPSYVGRGTSNSLGAYVLRFSVNTAWVTVTKGVFPTTVGVKSCVYNNAVQGPFTGCAV